MSKSWRTWRIPKESDYSVDRVLGEIDKKGLEEFFGVLEKEAGWSRLVKSDMEVHPELKAALHVELIERAERFQFQALQLREQRMAREDRAHSILIFFMKSDEAEVLLGDLLEEFKKVRARKSDRLARRWFWWQLLLIVVHQLDARLSESKLLGKFLRRR